MRACAIRAQPLSSKGFNHSLRHCWGVVQLVGHLTVNEDGVGSSPTAPAKFSAVEFLDLFFQDFPIHPIAKKNLEPRKSLCALCVLPLCPLLKVCDECG